MIKLKYYILGFVIGVSALSGCGRKSEKLAPPRVTEEIAAIVNDTEIPLQLVTKLYNQLPPAHKEYYVRKKGRRTFLDDLINRELIVQAAFKESTLWADKKIENIKHDILKREVINKFLENELESLPPPTEEEIKGFYDANQTYRGHSFESVKGLLRNELLKEKRNQKKAEIIDLLRSLEVIDVRRENLKYLTMKPSEALPHHSEPLFLINNQPMTLGDAIRYYQLEYERIQFHTPNVPENLLNDFLDKAIGDELLFLAGKKNGYDEMPSITSAVNEKLNRSITKTFLDAKLKITKQPTEEELRDFYENNKSNFFVPKLYRLRQIMIKLPSRNPNIPGEIPEKAKRAYNKIKQNLQDFAEVAKELSEGPERAIGGDMGYFSLNQMIPEFQNAIAKMKVGDVSDIIKTQYGYHIIKLEDEKEPYLPPFNDIVDKVKNSYFKNLWDKKFEDLLSNLRKKAEIKVFEQYFIE